MSFKKVTAGAVSILVSAAIMLATTGVFAATPNYSADAAHAKNLVKKSLQAKKKAAKKAAKKIVKKKKKKRAAISSARTTTSATSTAAVK